MALQYLTEAPLVFLLLATVLLYSLALHELGHAWVASKVGDDTARNLGRITFNPFKHLDLIGSLLIFLVGFGWAKPVPIQPMNFRNYRWGMFWVSIAGVTVNFAIALLAIWILKVLGIRFIPNEIRPYLAMPGTTASEMLGSVTGENILNALILAARINIILVVFNLLPIPPLDGSKVVYAFASTSVQRSIQELERFGLIPVILIIVVLGDQFSIFIDTILSAIMSVFL